MLEAMKKCENCGATFAKDKRNTWKHWAGAKYCSRKCSAIQGAKKLRQRRQPIDDAFWAKVTKGGPDECWNWTGALDVNGYGMLYWGGLKIRAHRFALEESGAVIRAGLFACHTCDNRACVNPAHLYVGTAADNARDASLRDRFRRKLTPEDARSIRESAETSRALAERYSVSVGMVHHIRQGRKWRHV